MSNRTVQNLETRWRRKKQDDLGLDFRRTGYRNKEKPPKTSSNLNQAVQQALIGQEQKETKANSLSNPWLQKPFVTRGSEEWGPEHEHRGLIAAMQNNYNNKRAEVYAFLEKYKIGADKETHRQFNALVVSAQEAYDKAIAFEELSNFLKEMLSIKGIQLIGQDIASILKAIYSVKDISPPEFTTTIKFIVVLVFGMLPVFSQVACTQAAQGTPQPTATTEVIEPEVIPSPAAEASPAPEPPVDPTDTAPLEPSTGENDPPPVEGEVPVPAPSPESTLTPESAIEAQIGIGADITPESIEIVTDKVSVTIYNETAYIAIATETASGYIIKYTPATEYVVSEDKRTITFKTAGIVTATFDTEQANQEGVDPVVTPVVAGLELTNYPENEIVTIEQALLNNTWEVPEDIDIPNYTVHIVANHEIWGEGTERLPIPEEIINAQSILVAKKHYLNASKDYYQLRTGTQLEEGTIGVISAYDLSGNIIYDYHITEETQFEIIIDMVPDTPTSNLSLEIALPQNLKDQGYSLSLKRLESIEYGTGTFIGENNKIYFYLRADQAGLNLLDTVHNNEIPHFEIDNMLTYIFTLVASRTFLSLGENAPGVNFNSNALQDAITGNNNGNYIEMTAMRTVSDNLIESIKADEDYIAAQSFYYDWPQIEK